MSSPQAVHRLVISGDVKGSGRLGHLAKLLVRKVMYEIFVASAPLFETVISAGGRFIETEALPAGPGADQGDGRDRVVPGPPAARAADRAGPGVGAGPRAG